MESKDKRLILAIVLAFLMWGVVDFFFSPKPMVFLLGGQGASQPPAAAEPPKIGMIEEDVDLSKYVPEVEVKKVVRTVYEKPYEQFFLQDREDLLTLVRHEPVIELSGVNEPTVLKREGGSVNFALRTKAYYKNVTDVIVEFVAPQGWEYIPGTTTNRISANEDAMNRKLASLEDRVAWTDAGEVVAKYLTEDAVEPTAQVVGEPARLSLKWTFPKGLSVDQSIYLEFPLQTTGSHVPGPQEFPVTVTAYDSETGKTGDRQLLLAEMSLRVDVTAGEEALVSPRTQFRDWDSLLLSSGIGRRYREPLSGVGF
jgi:hypothetical protein